MKIREKVIFDTNMLRNTEAEFFLWWREELQKFSRVADIVLPDMVIGELRNQKRRQLDKHKDSFLKNPFHWIKKIDPASVKNFDNDFHINELEKNETIKYITIQLSNYSVLEQMKDMSLKKMPPFEAAENTDKGFKDTYIYFTILEYLQAIPDKYIFVCTWDDRLKEALSKHQNIILVNDFADYQKKSLTWLWDEYFLWRLNEYIFENSLAESPISSDNIIGFWLNIEGKQVIKIQIEGRDIAVLIEDREIVEHKFVDRYVELLNWLIQSQRWWNTHTLSTQILAFWYAKWFSDDEIESLMTAAIENPQISGTFHHTVKELFTMLYNSKKDILPTDLRNWIELLLHKN